MSEFDLTQADLNVSLRGEVSAEIIMFLPDKNITFRGTSPVTVNEACAPLVYTINLNSLVDFSKPVINMATFENNSWILDGSFLSPSSAYGGGGDSYGGYIANDMTDENGEYETNPIITVHLASVAPKVEYITMKFAGGIDTSYPKQYKIRTYDSNDDLIQEHEISTTHIVNGVQVLEDGLPMMINEIMDDNVSRLEFELVGTLCPHRRVRLEKIMFGKAEQVDPYYLQSWKVEDKASLVADSIPTKKFEYSIINFDGDYDIDNPGNKIPDNYNNILVLFTLSMDVDGITKSAPTKTFNLTDVSTTSDGLVTFTCGSVLDILTDTYDRDMYTGLKPINYIVNYILQLADISRDQVIFENNYGNYRIAIPISEMPMRDVIQRLAFSCGATLLVDDDNKIIFANTNVTPGLSTPKFLFDLPEPYNSAGILLEEPHAEALQHTKNIAMYSYVAKLGETGKQLGSTRISTTGAVVKITYSPSINPAIDLQKLADQHAVLSSDDLCASSGRVVVNWNTSYNPEPDTSIEVVVNGTEVNIAKSLPDKVTNDTLILDSGLAYEMPVNLHRPENNPNTNTFYYDDWYGAKFKYRLKTRGEYLIRAGDIILFETPFSNGEANRVGYVLSNSYSSDGEGEMEVIMIGNG